MTDLVKDTICRHCGAEFDPDSLPDDIAVQAGLILAQERYGDAGKVCADCLASRGRLAMMYDPSCHR
jgi:ribosomal protein L40E